MQNAYACSQLTQLMGRVSFAPGTVVHVDAAPQLRAVFHVDCCDERDTFQAGSQPVSKPPSAALPTSPSPPRRCVCLPAPAVGLPVVGDKTASTKFRKRPPGTSKRSRREVVPRARA